MRELADITLENEMDLILAYKKSIRIAELLGLSISTQTAFATAVSEVSREVIDKAPDGVAVIGTAFDDSRFSLVARITCTIDENFRRNNEGFEYARKLIPVLDTSFSDKSMVAMLKLGIPRSAKLDHQKIAAIRQRLKTEGPISAYEEVKLKNAELNLLNRQQELNLQQAILLDRKKNDFLSLAGHEINTPLTVLHSFLQMSVMLAESDPGAQHKFLMKALQQSSKLIQLVRQLMDISQIENGQLTYNKTETSYKSFLLGIVDSLTALVPYHRLEVEINHDGPVSIDHLRIEQVLQNLVTNAGKYSEPDTRISFRTGLSGQHILVEVADEGMGMPEETIQKIFNKFYRSETATTKSSGIGMGLYVASKIVADHEGTIEVESTPGKGSKFSILLPMTRNS